MRDAQSPFPSHRLLRQGLAGLVFLALVAVVSLPAARAAGPIGWLPLWLLATPLAALAALRLADLRANQTGRRGEPVAAAAVRRRARSAPARRRGAVRPARPRRGAGSPAAA